MNIGDKETQIARAQKGTYEDFLIAMYLYKNYIAHKLNTKKKISLMIRKKVDDPNDPDKSVYEVLDNPEFPRPSDPLWAECFEAAQDHIGTMKEIEEEEPTIREKFLSMTTVKT